MRRRVLRILRFGIQLSILLTIVLLVGVMVEIVDADEGAQTLAECLGTSSPTNFRVVDEARGIYRSGRPATPGEDGCNKMRKLKECGVTTVISFMGNSGLPFIPRRVENNVVRRQEECCRELYSADENAPFRCINDDDPYGEADEDEPAEIPTEDGPDVRIKLFAITPDERIDAFLSAVSNNTGRILYHCYHGEDRTGLAYGLQLYTEWVAANPNATADDRYAQARMIYTNSMVNYDPAFDSDEEYYGLTATYCKRTGYRPEDIDKDCIKACAENEDYAGGCDNCPNDANPEQEDSDEDGIGDVCDICADDAENDVDGDGICGDIDICPDSDDNMDGDGDGIPDGCDVCPYDPENDADGDGICADMDMCLDGADSVDSDSDAMPDACDFCPFDFENDFDGDGICGDVDICPYSYRNDADGDGYCEDMDFCPDDPNKIDWGMCGCNVSDADSDSDGWPDCVDFCPLDASNDSDGDGFCQDVDICPFDFENDLDGDGICGDIDICPFDYRNDADGDGYCEDMDFCPDDPNKIDWGICGCGFSDADENGNGWPDCQDQYYDYWTYPWF